MLQDNRIGRFRNEVCPIVLRSIPIPTHSFCYRISSSSDDALAREEELFRELTMEVLEHSEDIKRCAHILASFDVASSMGMSPTPSFRMYSKKKKKSDSCSLNGQWVQHIVVYSRPESTVQAFNSKHHKIPGRNQRQNQIPGRQDHPRRTASRRPPQPQRPPAEPQRLGPQRPPAARLELDPNDNQVRVIWES